MADLGDGRSRGSQLLSTHEGQALFMWNLTNPYKQPRKWALVPLYMRRLSGCSKNCQKSSGAGTQGQDYQASKSVFLPPSTTQPSSPMQAGLQGGWEMLVLQVPKRSLGTQEDKDGEDRVGEQKGGLGWGEYSLTVDSKLRHTDFFP